MARQNLKDILEKEYLRREYINDNALLLVYEEKHPFEDEQCICVSVMCVKDYGFNDIARNIVIVIPKKDFLKYEIKTNESGIAIFNQGRLMTLYDAQRNERIAYDFVHCVYERIFADELKEKTFVKK